MLFSARLIGSPLNITQIELICMYAAGKIFQDFNQHVDGIIKYLCCLSNMHTNLIDLIWYKMTR